MPHYYCFLFPMLMASTLFAQPVVMAPPEGLFTSPAMQLLMTGLLTAVIVFITHWLTQHNLKSALGNLQLSAEVTARELEATKKAQEKIAEHTAANTLAQAEITVKVNGQMTALNEKIAELSNALMAEKKLGENEKEKAATLAVQTEKDRGEAAAKLAVAQQAPGVPKLPGQPDPLPRSGDATSADAGGTREVVNVPPMVLPVENAKSEAPRIIEP